MKKILSSLLVLSVILFFGGIHPSPVYAAGTAKVLVVAGGGSGGADVTGGGGLGWLTRHQQ